MPYQIRNLLVTGAAGFIGSNFVRYMMNLYPQIQIISLDKLTYAGEKENLRFANQADNHHFVQGDILDKKLIETLLRTYKIDTIAHFAAESHVDNSIENPKVFF
jgi:dTDP-glucose 4,6-dehydratase